MIGSADLKRVRGGSDAHWMMMCRYVVKSELGAAKRDREGSDLTSL